MLNPKGIFPRVGIHLTVLLDGTAQELGSTSLVPLESPALHLCHRFSEPWQLCSKDGVVLSDTVVAIPNINQTRCVYLYIFMIQTYKFKIYVCI